MPTPGYLQPTASSRTKRNGSVQKAGEQPGSPRTKKLMDENAKLTKKVGNLTRLTQVLQKRIDTLEVQLARLQPTVEGETAEVPPEELPDLDDEIYNEKVAGLIKAQSCVRGFIIRRRFKQIVAKYSSSEMARPLRLRNKLVLEVFTTEQSYVKGLEEAHNLFMLPMTKELGAAQADKIFLNIATILAVHRSFVDALEHKVGELPLPMGLGELFLDLMTGMEVYKFYAENYLFSRPALEKLQKEKPMMSKVLPGGDGWAVKLSALLITPIQRVPRYVMLLKDLVKYTVAEHQGKQALNNALIRFQQLAAEINETTRNREGRARVHEIVAQLESVEPNMLMPLIRYGWLHTREPKLAEMGMHLWSDRFFVLRGNVLYVFKKEIHNMTPTMWHKKAIATLELNDYKVLSANNLKDFAAKRHKKDPANQVYLYEVVKGTVGRKPKFILAGKKAIESDLWIESLLTGQSSLTLGIYSDLLSKHRLVIKEGNVMMGTPANDPNAFTSTSALSSSSQLGESVVSSGRLIETYLVMFNDLMLLCKKTRKNRLIVREVIHIPAITFIDDFEDLEEDLSAGTGKGKGDGPKKHRIMLCMALRVREFVCESREEQRAWVTAIQEQWARFNQSVEQHEGARGRTAQAQLHDLKRQIDRRMAEREYLQSHISESLDTLYSEQINHCQTKQQLTRLKAIWEKNKETHSLAPIQDEGAEDKDTEATDPEDDFGAQLHGRALLKIIAKKEAVLADAQEDMDKRMERLNKVNMRIAELIRERDGWAAFIQSDMTKNPRASAPLLRTGGLSADK